MQITGTATSSANTAMYLAESDESHRATVHSPADSPPDLAVTEAVRPVPVPQLRNRRIGRDTDAGMEPGERSRAVRDRAQSDPGRETKEAMAGCDVAGPCVDGRVAVQRSLAARLQVEDLRADLERLDVRGPDRAKVAGNTLESRAVLRRVERLRPSGRSGSGRMQPIRRTRERPARRAPTASPRTLFGNPVRPAIEASFARGTSVTGVCAARSLFAAEVDLFAMSGFHIFPDLLGLPRFTLR